MQFIHLFSCTCIAAGVFQQSVALTGRNITGPPWRAAPWWVTLHMRVLQTTTDAREQNNTAIVRVIMYLSPDIKPHYNCYKLSISQTHRAFGLGRLGLQPQLLGSTSVSANRRRTILERTATVVGGQQTRAATMNSAAVANCHRGTGFREIVDLKASSTHRAALTTSTRQHSNLYTRRRNRNVEHG